MTTQRDGLAGLGVDPERVCVDHGLTGTTRARPGPREALAACRTGDTLVVTKLDRLARSCPTPWTSSTSSPPAASFSSSAAPCTN
ncbi:MAG: recombinase family protein [Nocardioidaceae bacterium]